MPTSVKESLSLASACAPDDSHQREKIFYQLLWLYKRDNKLLWTEIKEYIPVEKHSAFRGEESKGRELFHLKEICFECAETLLEYEIQGFNISWPDILREVLGNPMMQTEKRKLWIALRRWDIPAGLPPRYSEMLSAAIAISHPGSKLISGKLRDWEQRCFKESYWDMHLRSMLHNAFPDFMEHYI